MMTHHFVITSSLLIKIFKIDKFGDFSSDIDYNSSTGVLRDVLSLIIHQCDPKRPQGASGEHSVRQPRSSSKRSALVSYILKRNGFGIFPELIEELGGARNVKFGTHANINESTIKFEDLSEIFTPRRDR